MALEQEQPTKLISIGAIFSEVFQLIVQGSDFPTVDPRYRRDLVEQQQRARRNAVDPTHAQPYTPEKIAL